MNVLYWFREEGITRGLTWNRGAREPKKKRERERGEGLTEST